MLLKLLEGLKSDIANNTILKKEDNDLFLTGSYGAGFKPIDFIIFKIL